MFSCSKANVGSLIHAKDRKPVAAANKERGITKYSNGRNPTQIAPTNKLTVIPTLETMENLAKAVGHRDFGWVSITRRLRGVADAAETSEKSPYRSATLETVLANANRKILAATANELRTMISFRTWSLSVTRPHIMAEGMLIALKSVVARPISMVVPFNSKIWS